jgi:hypothetical protein
LIHIPQFVFANTSDACTEDQDVHFGGLPIGLTTDKWPSCKECGIKMTFLFQMKHDSNRLDLGREGRVLYLFQCETDNNCSTWDAEAGCNQVLLVEPEEWDNTPIDDVPQEETKMLPAIAVTSWETREQQEKEDVWTHLGGKPIWIQGEEDLGTDYLFAAQLDFSLRVVVTNLSELPIEETVDHNGTSSYRLKVGKRDVVWISASSSSPNTYNCSFANFGDSGSGYVFVNPAKEHGTGRFIWQCY